MLKGAKKPNPFLQVFYWFNVSTKLKFCSHNPNSQKVGRKKRPFAHCPFHAYSCVKIVAEIVPQFTIWVRLKLAKNGYKPRFGSNASLTATRTQIVNRSTRGKIKFKKQPRCFTHA